jgi:hypothetical protein
MPRAILITGVIGVVAGCLPATARGQFTVNTRVFNTSEFIFPRTIDEAESLLPPHPAPAGGTSFTGTGFPGDPLPTDPHFALRFDGIVRGLPAGGVSGAVLTVRSDDGFRFRLNGVVPGGDGTGGKFEFDTPRGLSATQSVPLSFHNGDLLELTYFQSSGGSGLDLSRSDPGHSFFDIPVTPGAVPEPAVLPLAILAAMALFRPRRRWAATWTV